VGYIFHGKPLFVIAASDSKNVSFEFVADCISRDFLTNLYRVKIQLRERLNYSLVHEGTQAPLVFDFNELLTAIGRIRDLEQCQCIPLTTHLRARYVELHPADKLGADEGDGRNH
jgi:hypothetical protein